MSAKISTFETNTEPHIITHNSLFKEITHWNSSLNYFLFTLCKNTSKYLRQVHGSRITACFQLSFLPPCTAFLQPAGSFPSFAGSANTVPSQPVYYWPLPWGPPKYSKPFLLCVCITLAFIQHFCYCPLMFPIPN